MSKDNKIWLSVKYIAKAFATGAVMWFIPEIIRLSDGFIALVFAILAIFFIWVS